MFKNQTDITQWLIAAESDRNKARGNGDGGYVKNREYYENYQKPEGVPDDISFVVRNLIWDYVNRFVSKLIGSKVTPVLIGGGEMKDAIMQLQLDILDENRFHELLLEDHTNMFAVEGIAGWKCMYDPYELCSYGLGKPTIFNLYYDEMLLDPNARSGTHCDDRARAYVKRELLDVAIQKYATDNHGNEIEEIKNKIHATASEQNPYATEQFVDIYELEFKREFYVPHIYDPNIGNYRAVAEWDVENQKFIANEEGQNTDPANIIPIRLCKYFRQPVINKDVFPRPAKLSGYDGFTIIPTINVSRRVKSTWPASNLHMLVDRQDSINVIESLILETSKASPKNNYIVSAPGGLLESDIIELKRKIGGIGQIILVKKPQAHVTAVSSPTIPTHLLQKLDIDLNAFDQAGNTGAPDRGQELDLSGRAIALQQDRFDLTMTVAKLHLENSLNELFMRLTEMIVRKMTKPFEIIREIDGKERRIRYNTPAIGDVESDEFHTITEREGQRIINDLSQFKIPRIKIDVELNVMSRNQIEIQKAFAMFGRGQLAPIHLHKALYPKRWQETYEEAQKYNQALALMQQMSELGPEVMQAVTQTVNIAKQSSQMIEEQEGDGSNAI